MSYLELAHWQSLGDHQYRTVRIYESMLWCVYHGTVALRQ